MGAEDNRIIESEKVMNMAEVKWIKIVTDIFDDEKMLLIDGLPEHDGIIVIWFKLLCMAGKQNNGGVLMMSDKIAYTDEMLATIFRRPLQTVRLALKTFEEFGMIEIVNNAITIPNWEKHQSLDKLEQAKEKNRLRVAAHRERQKLLTAGNDYSNVTVMPCNDADKDIEEDKDTEEDKNDISTEFETLWKMYPRKLGKPKALKAYQKARKNGTTFEDVKKGIENYKKQIEAQKTSVEYIKHGSTWFNGECWNDEYIGEVNNGQNGGHTKNFSTEKWGGVDL